MESYAKVTAVADHRDLLGLPIDAEIHPAFRTPADGTTPRNFSLPITHAKRLPVIQHNNKADYILADSSPTTSHYSYAASLGQYTTPSPNPAKKALQKKIPRGNDADDTIHTVAPSIPASTANVYHSLYSLDEATPRPSIESQGPTSPIPRVTRTAEQNAQLAKIGEIYEISIQSNTVGEGPEATVKLYQYNNIGHFNPFHPANRAVVSTVSPEKKVMSCSMPPPKKSVVYSMYPPSKQVAACSMPPPPLVLKQDIVPEPPATPSTTTLEKVMSCSVPPPPTFDQIPPLTPPVSPSSSTKTKTSHKTGSIDSSDATSPITLLPALFEDFTASAPPSLSPPHSPSRRRRPSRSGSLTNSISSLRQRTSLLFSSPRLAHLFRTSTPLITAAKAGNTDEVIRLLSADAAKHGTGTDRHGLSALHHAALNGHADILRALIAHHASLESRTKKQDRTPLYYAAQQGHDSAVALLVAAGALVTEHSKWDGATPLHKSSQAGHLTTMQLLLAAGADVDARDGEGMRPLFWASQGEQLAAAKMLIEHGADLEARIRGGSGLELRTAEGVTVLHKAVTTASHALVRLFLEAGADPNANAPFGMRCLHRAAAKGDLLIVAMLLEGGADVHATTVDGWTALHCAARYGHKKVGRMLVWAGADEARRTDSGLDVRSLGRKYGYENVLGGWSCG